MIFDATTLAITFAPSSSEYGEAVKVESGTTHSVPDNIVASLPSQSLVVEN